MYKIKNFLLIFTLVFIWYPAIFGWLPILPPFIVSALLVTLACGTLKIYKYDVGIIIMFITLFILVFFTFIYHVINNISVNPTSEFYIIILNFVVSPIIFLLVSRDAKLNVNTLITWVTNCSLFILLFSIANDTGIYFNQYDSMNRLNLPFVNGSLASTSISLVLVFLYILNVYKYKYYSKNIFTIISLLLILALVYLMSSRFALIIILLITIYYLFYLGISKKIKILTASVILIIFTFVLADSYSITLNKRFVSEVSSLELVANPLSDNSLATRVALWDYSLQEIVQHPFGYGYLKFVYSNFENHSVLGYRGLNTHNEILLQFLGIGWLPATLLMLTIFRISKNIIKSYSFKQYIPVLIAIVITSFFETYSNNPNSINIFPLLFFTLGVYYRETNKKFENV